MKKLMSIGGALVAFAVAVLGAVILERLIVLPPRDEPDQVHVIFTPIKNPAHEPIQKTTQDLKIFYKLRKLLSPLRLPHRLIIKIADCKGEKNAYYDNDVITICYDYLDFIWNNAAQAPAVIGLSQQAAFVGATVDLVFHEVGHAVFDMLKIPVLGREEDAADIFSVYMILHLDPEEAPNMISGIAFLGAAEAKFTPRPLSARAFADEHGLPAQRYFNLLCIAYGSDPKAFSYLRIDSKLPMGHLTTERADGCADEYKQIHFAMHTLVRPHMDSRLIAKVHKENWFHIAEDLQDATPPPSKGSSPIH